MYARHASVVIVKPAGTRSAPSTRVISATLAPLPPNSSRMSRLPRSNGTTHLESVIRRHATSSRVRAQADAAGVPLVEIPIPAVCPNDVYAARMAEAFARPELAGVDTVAFA